MPAEKLVDFSGFSGCAPSARAATPSTGSACTGSNWFTPLTVTLIVEEEA